jgi:hypothetical protein
MKTKPSRARRLLLLAGGVFGLLIMAVLGVYAWAWTSTDESTIARAMIWRESDVGDQHRFPARPIPTGARMSSLDAGVQADLVVSAEGKGLDELLRETDTLAFLVVPRRPPRPRALLRRRDSREPADVVLRREVVLVDARRDRD